MTRKYLWLHKKDERIQQFSGVFFHFEIFLSEILGISRIVGLTEETEREITGIEFYTYLTMTHRGRNREKG